MSISTRSAINTSTTVSYKLNSDGALAGESNENQAGATSLIGHRTNSWSSLPMLDNGRLINCAQETLLNCAQETLPENVTLISSIATQLMTVKKESIIQQINEGQNLIFIPIVLKSAWRWFLPKYFAPSHLVVITVDKEEKKVEYFDPKGKNPFEETRSVNLFEGSLPNLLAICNRAIGNEVNTISYNPAVFQVDFSSCGYFGAHFMKLRSSDSFVDVLNTKMDITTIRESIDALDKENAYTNPEKLNPNNNTSLNMDGSEIDDLLGD